MSDWQLPEQMKLAPPFKWNAEVLVDYEGPRIVIGRGNGPQEWLGIAADTVADINGGEEVTRWIFTRLSHVERDAMFLGAATLHQLFMKDTVWVLDILEGQLCRSWEVWHGELTDDVLPDRGALLPTAARRSHEKSEPRISVDTLAGEPLSFLALSDYLSAHQRLWMAIGEANSSDGGPKTGDNYTRFTANIAAATALRMPAATAGSLRLEVVPAEEHFFKLIARDYEALVEAADDAAKLLSLLSRLGPRVQARYDELLKKLAKHELHVMTEREGGVSFTAGYQASSIQAALPSGREQEPMTLRHRGSFVAFDSTGLTFSFQPSEESAAAIEGDVDKSVVEKHKVVAVGTGAKYRVVIERVEHRTRSGHVTNVEFRLVHADQFK